ncbi:MAG: hypothetical protein U1F67_18820 [Rubrivivax sp.]
MNAMSRPLMAFAAAAWLLAGCASMEEDWERTKKLDSSGLYEQFVRMYPDSPHVAEAKQRAAAVVERVYARTKTTNTRDGYRQFMQLFHNYPRAKDAERDLEDLWWADTKGASDRAGLRAYLREYPQGRYVAEGRAAYERLLAPLLAAASWDSGEAPQGCNWVCRGTTNCSDAGAPGPLMLKTLAYASMKTPPDMRPGTLFQHVANDVLAGGKPIICEHSRRSGANPVHFTICRQSDPPVSASFDMAGGTGNAVIEWRRTTVEPGQMKAWQRDCG